MLPFAILLLFLLQGCKAAKVYRLPMDDAETPVESDDPPPEGDLTKNPDAEPETPGEETIWSFLKKKYDADGDGTVSRAEYDRGDEQFARLDRNHDGRLTGEDFGRGRAGMMAQMALARYFQADDKPGELKLEEIGQTFAKADANKDGVLSMAEFELLAESAPQPGGRTLPAARLYRALVTAADGDDSGTVTQAELEAFFRARDSNNDGVWTMSGRGRGDPRATGAKEGTVAPDFTLRPPGSGKAVTLSSFRGKRPVVLIFGSYT